jgi:hypothetical protein
MSGEPGGDSNLQPADEETVQKELTLIAIACYRVDFPRQYGRFTRFPTEH